MLLAVKTGMADERRIASRYAGQQAMVLSGMLSADDLDKEIPYTCQAIISVGLCGGLAAGAVVGEGFVCNELKTLDGSHLADAAWGKRLIIKAPIMGVPFWSSGNLNTANNKIERDYLFERTGCWVIDDETRAVAEFAVKRRIPFQALRVVSDGERDNLPPAVIHALNKDGTTNIEAVIASVATDPWQIPAILKTALEYKKSLDSLEYLCQRVGSMFSWI